jgi:hypothetical protein
MNLNDRIVKKAIKKAEELNTAKASDIDQKAMFSSLGEITGLSKDQLDQIAKSEKKKYFVEKVTIGLSIFSLAVASYLAGYNF